jgi:hypothetical protein
MAQPGIPATLPDRRWVILSEVAVAQLMVVPRFRHREHRPAVGPAGAGISGSIGASAPEHDRVHGGYRLPDGAAHGTAGSVDRRTPRLHPGVRAVRRGAQARCDPRGRPAAVLAPACGTQERGRGGGCSRFRVTPTHHQGPASGHQEGQSGESARKPQRADYQRVPRQPRAVPRRIQRRTAAAPAPTERRAQERHDRQAHDLQTSSAMTGGRAHSQRQAIPVDDPVRPPLDEVARRALIARSVALGPHYRPELLLPGAQR